MDKQVDLKITGDSDIGGGEYGIVKITGTLTASESFSGKEIHVVGDVRGDEDITCGELKVMGTLSSRKLVVKEKASIMGTLTAKEIDAEVFKVYGTVNCGKEFNCSRLMVSGSVDVGTLLNAEELSIKSGYTSHLPEAGGKILHVRGKTFSSKCALQAGTVEFDEIDVKNTEAEILRGVNVKVGRHCKIGLLEYSGTLDCHPQARVAKTVKI